MMYRTSLIAALGLFAAACGESPANDAEQVRVTELQKPDQPASGSFDAPGKGIAVVSGSQAITIDISLPAGMDSFDPALADLIAARADVDSEALVASAEIDRREAENGGYPFHPHSLEVTWEQDGPQEGRLISFLGSYYAYEGGAHPNLSFEMINWDRDAAREVGFGDLFEDTAEARQVVRDALFDLILAAKRERLGGDGQSDEEMLDTWVRPAFESNDAVYERFTFARGADTGVAAGLVYHFAPYAVGSYAEGPYEAAVPASVFLDQLSPTYSGAFSDEALADVY